MYVIFYSHVRKDDANQIDGDGCSSTCAIETGYICNGASPDFCSPKCGDGIIAGGETCGRTCVK